ncbi:MAG: hypothetical protein ACE5G5_04380 [Candidatus Methylomirabilales bacterium]
MKQFLPVEDDVPLKFTKGYVRVKPADFLQALGVIFGDLLHTSLDRERSRRSGGR